MAESEFEKEVHASFNRMRGKLAGLIESWGLKPTQERGAIQTMKSMSYDAEAELVELAKKA